jgi:hypothetical protein
MIKISKRKFVYITIFSIFSLSIYGMRNINNDIDIKVTDLQLQEYVNNYVDKSFPVKKELGFFVKTVDIKDTVIDIHDGTVEIYTNVEGNIIDGKKFYLTVLMNGTPSYLNDSLYFIPENIRIQKFSFNKVLLQKNNKFDNLILTLAQDISTHVLKHHPVYRLKNNITGFVLHSSVESLKIENNYIIINVNLWHLSGVILISIMGLLIAIISIITVIFSPMVLI